MKKFVDSRPYADPEVAAQKLMEIASAVEAVQDGRIFIELTNGPFLFEFKGSPAEYSAGLNLAIDRGWLWKHESRTYVKLTPVGADHRNCAGSLTDSIKPLAMNRTSSR
jgi:hypothetical protein